MRLAFCFAALATLCQAQAPQTYLEIRLPSGVQSERVLIRYVVAGDDLGGWVKPQPGLPAYRISAIRNGMVASGIKAIVYAPGCGIETVDVAFPDAANRDYNFVCRATGTVRISGKVLQAERLSKPDVVLQAKYLAHWASAVLGLGGDVPLTIPLGEAAPPCSGRPLRIVGAGLRHRSRRAGQNERDSDLGDQ